ncbi:LysR family transcriptional regulator [Sphingomonas prati]|uniref:DNA-binding transcriptional LysR family regulator n=1 Tax=Sphingomonas prati TaxID=1843237 RepID=A0A7W9BRX3_9SPHN|nr:LysR family transcriptional regulator [Sphingomonas prati]MBB5729028.1 DNA-binding transcriptional LysR family regulator [Sphingomonas prati]GGE85626.1 LysR family transcriptional regulator [Sphingomonas prati]
MDRFDTMRLFVRIVERGNFSSAARDLQLPPATVTRAIQQLEARLGARLLERTTRTVRPTDDGAVYYARCVLLLADLDEVESGLRAGTSSGPLCVDMQGTLARFFVLPALPAFIRRYPNIELRLSETDRMIDLVEEGIDCVLRAGVLPDSSLVGRQVAVSEQLTLASRAYIDRHGIPETLEDLSQHRMVGYLASASGQPYALDFTVDGMAREVMMPFDIVVRGAEIYTAAGLAGMGLIQVPRYRIQKHLDAGELVSLLPRHPPPPMPVSLLHPGNRSVSPRARVFADWLTTLFQGLQHEGRL